MNMAVLLFSLSGVNAVFFFMNLARFVMTQSVEALFVAVVNAAASIACGVIGYYS